MDFKTKLMLNLTRINHNIWYLQGAFFVLPIMQINQRRKKIKYAKIINNHFYFFQIGKHEPTWTLEI